MNSGLAPPHPAPLPAACLPRNPSKPQQPFNGVVAWRSSSNPAAPEGLIGHSLSSSELKSIRIRSDNYSRFRFRCNSSTNSGGPPGSGDNEAKSVLDAFFLGKALAEALNERIESTVGEFLSEIGRLQAEQQKQIQEFQEDVFERAKKAKERAAREAMEAQGLIPKSSAANISEVSNGVLKTSSDSDYATLANSSISDVQPSISDSGPKNEDPFLGVSNEEGSSI